MSIEDIEIVRTHMDEGPEEYPLDPEQELDFRVEAAHED